MTVHALSNCIAWLIFTSLFWMGNMNEGFKRKSVYLFHTRLGKNPHYWNKKTVSGE